MPVWVIPLVIQAIEAVVAGGLAAAAAYTATHGDLNATIAAGLAAAVGKVVPKQIIGGSNAKQG